MAETTHSGGQSIPSPSGLICDVGCVIGRFAIQSRPSAAPATFVKNVYIRLYSNTTPVLLVRRRCQRRTRADATCVCKLRWSSFCPNTGCRHRPLHQPPHCHQPLRAHLPRGHCRSLGPLHHWPWTPRSLLNSRNPPHTNRAIHRQCSQRRGSCPPPPWMVALAAVVGAVVVDIPWTDRARAQRHQIIRHSISKWEGCM
jgi:hypothetical protein